MAKDVFRNWWSARVARFGGWLVWRASVARGGFVYVSATPEHEAEYVPQENVLFFLMKCKMELEAAREEYNKGPTDELLETFTRRVAYFEGVLGQVGATVRLGLVGQTQVEELVLRATMHRLASPNPNGNVVQPEQTFTVLPSTGEKLTAADADRVELTQAQKDWLGLHDKQLPVSE